MTRRIVAEWGVQQILERCKHSSIHKYASMQITPRNGGANASLLFDMWPCQPQKQSHTDKKEKKGFLIYKEIQSGSGADKQSHI
jgi:hypothetical protein